MGGSTAALVAMLLRPPSPHAGHSMGGSTAALVAMLLRNDTRLIMRVSSAVRAVCLGPATVLDLHTAMACRDFVASVVYGERMVLASRTPTITKDLWACLTG